MIYFLYKKAPQKQIHIVHMQAVVFYAQTKQKTKKKKQKNSASPFPGAFHVYVACLHRVLAHTQGASLDVPRNRHNKRAQASFEYV